MKGGVREGVREGGVKGGKGCKRGIPKRPGGISLRYTIQSCAPHVHNSVVSRKIYIDIWILYSQRASLLMEH